MMIRDWKDLTDWNALIMPDLTDYPRLPQSLPSTSSVLESAQLVPVHKEDFKKINEFAEAAWLCRDPENSDNIKEVRRNLLREVRRVLVFLTNYVFSSSIMWR